jgi:hypothetical protein
MMLSSRLSNVVLGPRSGAPGSGALRESCVLPKCPPTGRGRNFMGSASLNGASLLCRRRIAPSWIECKCPLDRIRRYRPIIQAPKYPDLDKMGTRTRRQSAVLGSECINRCLRARLREPALDTQPPSPPGPKIQRAGPSATLPDCPPNTWGPHPRCPLLQTARFPSGPFRYLGCALFNL